jgi:hypothetical protein
VDQNNTIKLSPDGDNIVELLYPTPKTGTNNYGNWYLYGVMKDGQETGFFATDSLHKKLSVYGQGARVNIVKEEYAPNKYAWTVTPLSGTKPSTTPTVGTKSIDDRTHDIHKQVCLKLAVELFGVKKGGILSDTDMVAIDTNMQSLLTILESENLVNDLTKPTDPVKNGDMPF